MLTQEPHVGHDLHSSHTGVRIFFAHISPYCAVVLCLCCLAVLCVVGDKVSVNQFFGIAGPSLFYFFVHNCGPQFLQ